MGELVAECVDIACVRTKESVWTVKFLLWTFHLRVSNVRSSLFIRKAQLNRQMLKLLGWPYHVRGIHSRGKGECQKKNMKFYFT